MELIFRGLFAALIVAFVLHRGFYARRIQHSGEIVRREVKPGRVSQIAGVLALPALLATSVYMLAPCWLGYCFADCP